MNLAIDDGNVHKFFTCQECGSNFKQRSFLKVHVKSIHRAEKIPCTFSDCDRTFTQNSHLQSHIKSIHQGETFSCPVCDSQFKQKGQLQKHIDSIHVNIVITKQMKKELSRDT